MKAGQVLAMVQPHLSGTDLLTLISTQQQILALEMELTVKAAGAESEAIRHGQPHPSRASLAAHSALREQNAKSARELEEAEFAQRKAEADLSAAEALRKTYDQRRSSWLSVHVRPARVLAYPRSN